MQFQQETSKRGLQLFTSFLSVDLLTMFLIDFLVGYPLQRLVQSSALQKDNSLYMYIKVWWCWWWGWISGACRLIVSLYLF